VNCTLERVSKHSGRTLLIRSLLLAAAVGLSGCAAGPHLVLENRRNVIDRAVVEYPNQMILTPYIGGLTSPCAVAFETEDPDYKGSVLVAEAGVDGDPRVFGFKPDGTQFWIYPKHAQIPFLSNLYYRIYGPIGGMVVSKGKIYVSHRDKYGMGVITQFDYNGNHNTVVGDLPAQGDYGVTDLAIHPINGRLYFGVGAATNSGVVGLDNWEEGWVNDHPEVCDRPLYDIKLNGFRFTTINPKGGLFGGDDIANTGPFQKFGASRQVRIPKSPVGKPTAAIYSVNIEGGDLRVEAHGIRLPRGLVFNEFGNLFATDNGMEMRGTRPVKDDPDSVLRVPLGAQIWYGWPDYTADLEPVSNQKFQPPQTMIIATGYPEIAPIIDRESSGLVPADRNQLLRGVFPALSGAAKMALVGDTADEVFKPYRGNVIVALSGDRAPFANNNQKLVGPQGYTVKRVDLDTKQVSDFVQNTKRLPQSMIRHSDADALERPIDAKFGPDGALYIVDYGQMIMKHGQERVEPKTGKIFRLGPLNPTTRPSSGQ